MPMIGTDATRSDRHKFRRRAEPVWTNLCINTAVRARAGRDGAAYASANAAFEAERSAPHKENTRMHDSSRGHDTRVGCAP